ncbi:hypothetical protein [Arthrobacter sp. Y81]|uniref:hypothetical protein n=1 Tax=Arthrobacter sp. Y81 TaxID=2058897 RepID=UPI000CE474CF|nr:hypothetical protein [Arthrobacter sp. Y81]
MKKILAVVAFAGMAGLTACAATGPDSGSGTETSAPKTETSSAPAPSPSASKPASKSASAAGTSGVKEACETFNSLYADYKAIQNDSNAYEDIYLAADDAQDTVTGNLVGLFASLKVLAIDHSSAVDTGGKPEQESKDAVRDAVFANAGECTAAGVTLRL